MKNMERQIFDNAVMDMDIDMQDNGMNYLMENSETGGQQYAHGYVVEGDATERFVGQVMQMQFQGNYGAAEYGAAVCFGAAAVANDYILTPPAFAQENRFAPQVVSWQATATGLDNFGCVHHSAAEDEAPVHYGAAAVANDYVLTPPAFAQENQFAPQVVGWNNATGLYNFALAQENQFAPQVVGWQANATGLDNFASAQDNRFVPNTFMRLAPRVKAAVVDHDFDRPFHDIILAPMAYFAADFTNHAALEEGPIGTWRYNSTFAGQYYHCFNGLRKPLRDIGHPDVDMLDRHATAQIEKYLPFARLHRHRLGRNQQPPNASISYKGATCNLLLWDINSISWMVRHGVMDAYKEFVARMEPIIRSCANVFRHAQPRVYDEAIRLRNARVGEPGVDNFPQLAQNCFETVKIVANCALVPRRLSKTRPWSVIVVLGNHISGGGFTLSMAGGDQRWGENVSTNSSASDILIVDNGFEVGNLPFVAHEGATMYLLQLFLPRMGHEFDII